MPTDFSADQVARLIRESDEAPSSDAKGDKLEELAKYLFVSVGMEFERRNILDKPRAHELDVAFWNPPSTTLHFFDSILVVECKSHDTAVGSHDVGWFVRKLQDRGMRAAVLLSLSGITGSNGDDATNAHSEIINAMMRDGIRILVLTRTELLRLRGASDLTSILKRKFLELTLSRTVLIAPPPGS
jgi:hypothetical protein